MADVYRPEAWHDVFLMLGGAAAALTGLVLLAVSLHLDEVMKSVISRTRALVNICALAMVIVLNTFALIPQSAALLGAEVSVINALGIYVTIRFIFRHRRELRIDARLRMAAGITGCLIGLAGGTCLLVSSKPQVLFVGTYAIALNFAWVITLVILNAWAILVGFYREDEPLQGES